VAGDIVTKGSYYRRSDGVWMMTPSGTRGMFHVDPQRRELLDEIERLRDEVGRLEVEVDVRDEALMSCLRDGDRVRELIEHERQTRRG
jgi:hypothetical protein